ncbi:MAG: recombinase family protein [bacterium]
MLTKKHSPKSGRLVVGYVRVSTARQAAEGQSIDAQVQRIHAYAKANDLTVDKVYTENGASGKNTDRPVLTQLLADLDDIGVVIVYKFDRISRSVVDLYSLLERFQTAGITFKSVSEGVDTGSAVGKFMMNVLAGLAQMERELIGERTKDTLASKQARGEHCGRIPFGFRMGDDGHLERDPSQQLVIARIKRLRRNGRSERDISERLSLPKSTVHIVASRRRNCRNGVSQCPL